MPAMAHYGKRQVLYTLFFLDVCKATWMDEPETPKLMMKIDITVLEHLGLKMYTSLPAVLAEYVSNAWDAGSTEVNIEIPDQEIDEDYGITIRDNGFGMTKDEVNTKFLIVGRARARASNRVHGEKRNRVLGYNYVSTRYSPISLISPP